MRTASVQTRGRGEDVNKSGGCQALRDEDTGLLLRVRDRITVSRPMAGLALVRAPLLVACSKPVERVDLRSGRVGLVLA